VESAPAAVAAHRVLRPLYLFPWAGKYDDQWSAVYPRALRNRTIFFAGADPTKPEPAPPRKVIFDFPKFNA